MKTTPTSLAMTALLATLPMGAAAQQAVILARHAELQGAAMAEPKSLPLSEAGEARAQRLAALLKDAGIGAVYVTDFVRTNKTGEPLARQIGKELTVLPKGDPQQLVDRLRRDHADQSVLLVGHTDTLPGILKALGVPGDISIEAQDYGNVFVVVPKGAGTPAFLRLRY